MKYTEVMVRYGELSTKGKNRKDFIGRLAGNVTKVLRDFPQVKIYPRHDRSSNTGFVHIERQMGAKTWREYLNRFHIGKKTGVTLPGEQPGLIAFKSPIDQAVTSFGQGINVNVMQMMQAYSSLANNGQMVKPQYVDKITDSDGKTLNGYQIKKVGQPVYSPSTRKVVLDNMKRVLNKKIGTGYAYKMSGDSIAVKTGTAQIANPKGGGYLKGNSNYIFSVVGVTPADRSHCEFLTAAISNL